MGGEWVYKQTDMQGSRIIHHDDEIMKQENAEMKQVLPSRTHSILRQQWRLINGKKMRSIYFGAEYGEDEVDIVKCTTSQIRMWAQSSKYYRKSAAKELKGKTSIQWQIKSTNQTSIYPRDRQLKIQKTVKFINLWTIIAAHQEKKKNRIW